MSAAKRPSIPALALLLTLAAFSWLAMMVVHESGHVLATWATGGRVTRVVLHPLAFSRADVAPNPHPLAVALAGPLWGAAAPLLLWLIALAARLRLAFLLRFFAGFCLVANGAYMASGAFTPVGDAEDLLRMGVPWWTLTPGGTAAVIGGLALWRGLGTPLGCGSHPVERGALAASTSALAIVLIAMCAWSARS